MPSRRVSTIPLFMELQQEATPSELSQPVVRYLKRIWQKFAGPRIMESCFNEDNTRGIPPVPDISKSYILEYDSVTGKIVWSEIV